MKLFARRRHERQSKLSNRQLALLLYGESMGQSGRGFTNLAEEEASWTEHREELLASTGFARPAGYFRHELCADTPQWIAAAEKLFRSGLFADRIDWIERMSITMSGDQDPDVHSDFETPESILALNLPYPNLEALLRELGHAQAWHAFRGRPALVEKYSRIGAALRQVLRESLILLKPKESLNAN